MSPVCFCVQLFLLLATWLLIRQVNKRVGNPETVIDIIVYSVDRDSSVDIAIRYGLDGPRIESR
jgi:hypothetical protein